MEKLIKHFTSGLFLCLTISAIAVGQDFSAIITATGTGGSSYDLTFGFSPDATDGYDGAFCSDSTYTSQVDCESAGGIWTEAIDAYAPPAPPPPAFDAALSWGGDRYYIQVLAGDGDLSEHVYDIALAYGSDNLITITWDTTGWSDMMTSCILEDAFGGGMFSVDMLSETSLTLDNPAFNTLKLKVTPTDYVVNIGHETMIPGLFALHQNYPNPFNPITTLHYDLPEQATVNIIIYDMLGRKIAQLVSSRQEAGDRSVQWDATDMYGKSVSAGIYLYQIQAGEFVQTRKMVLLK